MLCKLQWPLHSNSDSFCVSLSFLKSNPQAMKWQYLWYLLTDFNEWGVKICTKLDFTSFGNFYFSQKGVIFEMQVPEATARKLYLSSIQYPYSNSNLINTFLAQYQEYMAANLSPWLELLINDLCFIQIDGLLAEVW